MTPCLVLALLLAGSPLWAAGGARGGPQVYSAPSSRWTAALDAPVASFAGGAASPLAAVAALGPNRRALSLAPVVLELQRGLHLTPEKFAALAPQDQRTALELAAEQAQTAVTQRSYELVGQAKALVWSEEPVDREGLKELYRLASHLQEIRRHYGPYLGEDERDAVAAAAAQASSRYRDARSDFIRRFGLAVEERLRQRRGPEDAPVENAAQGPRRARPPPIEPSTAARKLLERMRETKVGWGEKDVETVYLGHGFTYRDGAKHRVYSHPFFPHVRTSVSRQTELKPAYVRDAIRLIEEAVALSAPAAAPALVAAAHGADDAPLPPVPDAPAAKPAPKKDVARVELPVQRLETAVAVAEPARAPAPTAELAAAEPEPAASAEPEAPPAPEAPPQAEKRRSGWRRLLDRLSGR